MSNLMLKDEAIKTSPVYLGYMILKILHKTHGVRLSIFDLHKNLKKDFKIISYRQIILALIFLYTSGAIDFTEPYIYQTSNGN